jgi:hypothetical protein
MKLLGNFEVATEPEGWWWLSFCDTERPKGQQFLGACIVRGRGVAMATITAHLHGCNPGGEVMAIGPVPVDTKFPDGFTERLLTRTECEEFERLMPALHVRRSR